MGEDGIMERPKQQGARRGGRELKAGTRAQWPCHGKSQSARPGWGRDTFQSSSDRYQLSTMDKRRLLIRIVPIAIALLVVFFQYTSSEKVTNEAGRTARYALNSDQEKALGLQSYRQVLSEVQTVDSGPEYELVKRVAGRLAAATGDNAKKFEWSVSVVRSNQVNAFCLPGGKIVVYTGILPVAKSEAGLATVMGHEMAHATLRHGSERLLQQKATQTIMTGVQVSVGDMSYEQQRAVMGALGAGAQYGVLLPFSRDHESEADTIGLRYMARAGY